MHLIISVKAKKIISIDYDINAIKILLILAGSYIFTLLLILKIIVILPYFILQMISRRNENNTPDPIRHIASSSRVIIQRPSSAAAHRSYVRFTELGRIDNAIRIPTRNNPTRAP